MNRAEKSKELRKYAMPDCVATSARLGWLAVHGEPFRVARSDAAYISGLECGVGLYGGGFLLSERAAAERAAAERAVLSPRELALQATLGKKDQ